MQDYVANENAVKKGSEIRQMGDKAVTHPFSDILAHDSLGDFFPDAEANTDNLASELDEAVGSREWLALTKSPQAFYGSQPSWQGSPGAVRGSRDILAGVSSSCCEWGCSKSQISSLC
ncbi:relaxin-3-like [Microtus oregoni]|uniref:relaxin-3-like n=1 Tax=Microtus oregoni TaxID=111838 RepID=UPI001BB26B7E|nr:relaxin-3-like [Microtus oregoni]